MNKQTDREKAQAVQFQRLAAENAELRAEVARLRDWMQRVTDAVVDWRTKVTGTAGSGCPIDAVVILAARLRRGEAEIERLKKACELYRQASIQSHRGHVRPRHPELQGDWDPTGKWGAGCPECDRASQLRSEAEAALKEEDTHEMA